MKTIDDISMQTWFSERELDYVPPHFIPTKVQLTPESKEWILEKLQGRFAITYSFNVVNSVYVAFEDPKEAMFYELTWS